MKTVVIVNVGTPKSFEPQDVGDYLNEFLMDENIISIPRPFRDLLVKVLIVPRRKFSSAEKYKKIWTEKGSPLMVESKALQSALQAKLGRDWNVVLGMQVGEPSLRQVMTDLTKSGSEVYFCPMYPQFATATTGGAIQQAGPADKNIQLKVLKPFYNEPWFLKAVSDQIRQRLKPEDHLLLSYHGLPVSQLVKHRSECYKTSNCCVAPSACQQNCYRAQCLKTTELLKNELGLTQISTGFQSRLGRAQWIEPSTESVVRLLREQGVKHLKVACPSFVSDCLETLEEIGMELKHQFLSEGGETFELIPCVNDHAVFVEGLAKYLRSST